MDMGIVNAGQLALYDDIDPELRELVEDVILNRRADATDRLLEAAERYKGGEAQKREVDLSWREKPVEERLIHALVHGIGTYIDAGHRGGARQGRAAAPCHRRPADGRHERGRRSVRLGQDVPAASGEVGAGDEAGRRLSDALHGEGEGGAWARARRARRQDPARHRQGRRARHRQEHRRRRAPMQQLRGDRSRRHGAGAEDSRHGARDEGRHHRPLGPDHALARRDVPCRGRDGARGLRPAAADRRRHHQPRAHRRQDQPELSAQPGDLCDRRQPRGGRGLEPDVAGGAA